MIKEYTTRKNIFNKENKNKLCYIDVGHVDAFVYIILCRGSKRGTDRIETAIVFQFTNI